MKFEKNYDGDQTSAYRVTVPAYTALRGVFLASQAVTAWFKQTFSTLYVLLLLVYGSTCLLLSVFPKVFVTMHYLLGLWFVFVVMLPKLSTKLEGK